MSGQPIRAEGSVDPAAVESLGDRMAVIPERRGPVIGFALLAWAGGAGPGRRDRPRAGWPVRAVRLAALALVYLPLVLLVGAALEPSQGVEQLLAIFGAPLLALLTLLALAGYRALAVASGADRRSPTRST